MHGPRPKIGDIEVPRTFPSQFAEFLRGRVRAIPLPSALVVGSVLSVAFFQLTSNPLTRFVRREMPCLLQPCANTGGWFPQENLPLFLGSFLAAFLLYPPLSRIRFVRERWRWAPTVALAAVCAGLYVFVLHFGNIQFGGRDYGTIIDLGWRMVQGQRPYLDWVGTAPPAFILGLKYSFQYLGLEWAGMLRGTAIYSCVSLLWSYALFRRLTGDSLISFAGAFAIQSSAVVTMCFWWYNNVSSIAAAIFLISCVLYLEQEESVWVAASFTVSLALLTAAKPNYALPTEAACLALLLAGVSHRRRLLALTLGSFALFYLVLTMSGISIPAMIQSYRGVAGRGFPSVERFLAVFAGDRWRFRMCIVAMVLPFADLWPQFQHALDRKDRRRLASSLLLLVGPAVSLLVMFSNRDEKDLDFPLWLCGSLLILHGCWHHAKREFLIRCFGCFLVALVVSQVDVGATRYRVAAIGHPFAVGEDLVPPGLPFFRDMHASAKFHQELGEIGEAIRSGPHPVFLGPGLEYGYATFGLPSPRRLPVWWEAGAWFPNSEEPRMIEAWRESRFQTLVFLKDDYNLYPPQLKKMIWSLYVADNKWPDLTVYHARSSLRGGLRVRHRDIDDSAR